MLQKASEYMKHQGHLYLDEVSLDPSAEWEIPFSGWCFVWIEEGQGYWLGGVHGKVVQQLNTGELLVVFPSPRGVFRTSQLGQVRLQFFRFCPELLGGFLSVAERHVLETLAATANPGIRFLPAQHPAAIAFAQVSQCSRTNNGLVMRCQVLQVAGLVFARELANPKVKEAAVLTASTRIKLLMNQLTEGEMLDFSSSDLATRCGCSVRHFSRLFLNRFHVSFRSKQTELRLIKARQLLDETSMKVMEVARASGYRHLGLFNASFKKRFGLTPSESRRLAQRPRARQKEIG